MQLIGFLYALLRATLHKLLFLQGGIGGWLVVVGVWLAVILEIIIVKIVHQSFWVSSAQLVTSHTPLWQLISTKDKTPRLTGSFVKPILGLRQKVPALVSRVFNIFYIRSISQIQLLGHGAWSA